MRTLKKVVTVVAALALTVGMTVNCFAADTWGSYFGMEEGAGLGLWYEGSDGTLKSQTADSWTADIKAIGWGGVWGGQVFQDSKKYGSVSVKKGQEYHIKFTLKSSKVDKWAFIKIAKGDDNIAYGKWVRMKKGQAVTVDEDFKAATDANTIYFGIGGEYGDRASTDGTKHYSYAEGGAEGIAAQPDADGDSVASTVITCTGYSLTEKADDSAASANPGASSSVTTNTNNGGAATTTTTVTTGDFDPYIFAGIAVLAAAAVVIFSRKRETE